MVAVEPTRPPGGIPLRGGVAVEPTRLPTTPWWTGVAVEPTRPLCAVPRTVPPRAAVTVEPTRPLHGVPPPGALVTGSGAANSLVPGGLAGSPATVVPGLAASLIRTLAVSVDASSAGRGAARRSSRLPARAIAFGGPPAGRRARRRPIPVASSARGAPALITGRATAGRPSALTFVGTSAPPVSRPARRQPGPPTPRRTAPVRGRSPLTARPSRATTRRAAGLGSRSSLGSPVPVGAAAAIRRPGSPAPVRPAVPPGAGRSPPPGGASTGGRPAS